jgi:UDP-N-acetylmuramyl pentapeptide phosphotransferase/UDP-N-acetylglucosamine-1-phosphate transferase
MEIDEIKSIWNEMNTRLEKSESLNLKILNEIMDNRHQTAKDKLMKYEVFYLVFSAVFSFITPLYYFGGLYSLAGCMMFTGLFVFAALWQVYKIVLLQKMKMDKFSTTELLQKALRFKIITRMRTVIGLTIMIPFFAIFLMLSPQLMNPAMLTGMGVGVVVGLIIGLADYFKNQKDIDKLIKCYKDIQEFKD